MTAQNSSIGDYRIIRELGRGRIAKVLFVRDKLGNVFALKVLHPYLATEVGIEMLRREARISQKLFHPSIARVIEYLFISPDNHCLLMEYAGNKDLGEYIKSKKVPIQEVIRIAWEICDAISYAHSKGVIHRDIKPQNIILGSGNIVKVTDFNLSSAAAESIASLTQGRLIGTPYYLSPEQANYEKGDERSDIYSIGILIYEMITGVVPFAHDNISVILDMHKNAKPTPIAHLRPNVPVRLALLVEKAMEKLPKNRFSSVEEMRRALEPIAREEGLELNEKIGNTSSRSKIKSIIKEWSIDILKSLSANFLWWLMGSVIVILFVLGILPNKLLKISQLPIQTTLLSSPTITKRNSLVATLTIPAVDTPPVEVSRTPPDSEVKITQAATTTTAPPISLTPTRDIFSNTSYPDPFVTQLPTMSPRSIEITTLNLATPTPKYLDCLNSTSPNDISVKMVVNTGYAVRAFLFGGKNYLCYLTQRSQRIFVEPGYYSIRWYDLCGPEKSNTYYYWDGTLTNSSWFSLDCD